MQDNENGVRDRHRDMVKARLPAVVPEAPGSGSNGSLSAQMFGRISEQFWAYAPPEARHAKNKIIADRCIDPPARVG